jgi:hypothetical protein
MLKLLRIAAFIGAASFVPSQASAVVVTGFALSTPTMIFAGDTAQANATASPFEDYLGTSGSLRAGQDLLLFLTATINPYLNAVSTGGVANSISLDYQVNAGPLVNLAVTQTNQTGSAFVPSLSLNQDDIITFFVTGTAGPSGNDVDFNVTASAIPVPPAALLGLTAIAGSYLMMRRRNN